MYLPFFCTPHMNMYVNEVLYVYILQLYAYVHTFLGAEKNSLIKITGSLELIPQMHFSGILLIDVMHSCYILCQLARQADYLRIHAYDDRFPQMVSFHEFCLTSYLMYPGCYFSLSLEQCPCVATGYKYSIMLAYDLPVHNMRLCK